MVKTAPTCIVHHISYGKTENSIIFDHIYGMLHHINCILYHIYIYDTIYMDPRGRGPGHRGAWLRNVPQPRGWLYIGLQMLSFEMETALELTVWAH